MDLLFLAALCMGSLHGVSLVYKTKLITGLVPALQRISTVSGFDVAIWKHTLALWCYGGASSAEMSLSLSRSS